MKHVLLTLQKISWTSQAQGTSGNTWAYSNRKPQSPVNFFGDKNTAFTVSRLQKGVTPSTSTASDMLVTVWLNNVNDEEVELYKAEYGLEVYVDESDNLITVAQYEELMSQGSDVTEDTTSEQPFAE